MNWRIKGNVLLWSNDEHERSVLSFVLRQHAYQILGGISSHAPYPDAVLIQDDGSLAPREVARVVDGFRPMIPIVVMLRGKHLPRNLYPIPVQFITKAGRPQMEMVLYHLRMACCRRRKGCRA